MPAITLSEIKRSPTWSSLTRHLLAARQNYNFPTSSSSSSSRMHQGLHPAAIFGIVAGVMLLIIVTVWICWFRLVKKALTHRDYGVLPSIRTAANNHNNPSGATYPYGPGSDPYGQQPQYGGYGNNNMSHNYGASPTQYPPPAHHHNSPPPYDPGNSPYKPTDTSFGYGHTSTDNSGAVGGATHSSSAN